MTKVNNNQQKGKMAEKTHWKKLYNKTYLGEWDLPAGSDLIATIQEVKQEEIVGDKGRKDVKPVVYFAGEIKPMILNVINGKTIAGLYGKFIEDWAGKSIRIFFNPKVKMGSHTVGGLRIREVVPSTDTKADIKAKIRTALKDYTGEDKDEIKALLNEKQSSKEDTPEFLNNILEQLTTVPA